MECPVIEVGLIDRSSGEMAPFCLTFYGLHRYVFAQVPCLPVAEAMKRNRLEDRYLPSFYHIRQRFNHAPPQRPADWQPRRRRYS